MGALIARQAADAAIRLCRGRADVGQLTRGLSSYGRRSKMDWDEYTTLLERVVAALGGPTEIERVTEDSYLEGYPQIRAVMGRLMSPGFFLYATAAIGAQFFPCSFRVTRLEEDRIHWRIELNEDAKSDSFWLFLGNIPTARATSLQLGMPANQVDAIFTGRRGDYWIRVPPSMALPSKVFAAGSRALRRLVTIDDDAPPAPRLNGNTLRIVRSFGEKLTNASDAQELVQIALQGVSDLVGGDDVVLWRRPNNGPRLELIARRGSSDWNSMMAAYSLRIAGNEFGRIDVRGGQRSGLLEALVPWLSMALAHVVSQSESTPRTLGDRLADFQRRFGLTARQQEVLARAANGMSNKKIAEALQLSTKTVEFHLQHLFSKLAVQNRVQLARLLFARE